MGNFNLSDYVNQFSYLGIYLWFAVLEQLTPIPEEAFLVSLGYIAIKAGLNIPLCGITAVAGLISCDMFLFLVAHKGSRLAKNILHKVNRGIIGKIRYNLKQHPVKTLIVMALIPKIRFVSPIVSGIAHIRWQTFVLVNTLATAFYVSVYVGLGVVFHNGLSSLMKKIEWAQHIIFIAAIVVAAIYVIFRIKKWTSGRPRS